jgi:4'-phosphopantetheinyl transferase
MALLRSPWVSDADVHVIQASVSELSGWAIDRLSLLDDGERTRLAGFRREEDRSRFVVSHVFARVALSSWLDEEPASLRFAAGLYGKPQLAGGRGARFNLSHSGDRVAFAMARDREVGVDVEKVSRVDVLDLARCFFSPREYQQLATTPTDEQAVAFYRCWSRKESFIKALGVGLSYQLSTFTVETGHSSGQLLIDSEEFGPHPTCWTILALDTGAEYAGSVTVESGSGGVRFWRAQIDRDLLAVPLAESTG